VLLLFLLILFDNLLDFLPNLLINLIPSAQFSQSSCHPKCEIMKSKAGQEKVEFCPEVVIDAHVESCLPRIVFNRTKSVVQVSPSQMRERGQEKSHVKCEDNPSSHTVLEREVISMTVSSRKS